MPLILFDTPQISMLEAVRRNDRVRYRSFLDRWKAGECTLVFTHTEASELRRYSNDTRRYLRYEVVADLAPIRTDIATPGAGSAGPRMLMEREIMRSLVERGLIKGTSTEADELNRQWADVLPGRLSSETASLWLRSLYENPLISGIVSDMYCATRYTARADKRRCGHKKIRRLKNIASERLSEGQAQAYKAEIEKQRTLLQEGVTEDGLPAVPSSAWALVEPVLDQFSRRCEEVGPRRALLEHLNLAGVCNEDALKRSVDELIGEHAFQFQVRKFAVEMLNAGEKEREFLLRRVTLTDCPGSWLWFRLRACIRHRVANPRPNHYYDVDRLAYLPYVDLLITDKQMAQIVREIMLEESTPQRIREAPLPASIPDSMAALESAIDSLRV